MATPKKKPTPAPATPSTPAPPAPPPPPPPPAPPKKKPTPAPATPSTPAPPAPPPPPPPPVIPKDDRKVTFVTMIMVIVVMAVTITTMVLVVKGFSAVLDSKAESAITTTATTLPAPTPEAPAPVTPGPAPAASSAIVPVIATISEDPLEGFVYPILADHEDRIAALEARVPSPPAPPPATAVSDGFLDQAEHQIAAWTSRTRMGPETARNYAAYQVQRWTRKALEIRSTASEEEKERIFND